MMKNRGGLLLKENAVLFAFGWSRILSPLVPFRESLQDEPLSNTIN
jgi:hypothetical protein